MCCTYKCAHTEVSKEQVEQLTGILPASWLTFSNAAAVLLCCHSLTFKRFLMGVTFLHFFWYNPASAPAIFSTTKSRLVSICRYHMHDRLKGKKNMKQTSNAPLLVRWQQFLCNCNDVTYCTVLLMHCHALVFPFFSFHLFFWIRCATFFHTQLHCHTGSNPSRYFVSWLAQLRALHASSTLTLWDQ